MVYVEYCRYLYLRYQYYSIAKDSLPAIPVAVLCVPAVLAYKTERRRIVSRDILKLIDTITYIIVTTTLTSLIRCWRVGWRNTGGGQGERVVSWERTWMLDEFTSASLSKCLSTTLWTI